MSRKRDYGKPYGRRHKSTHHRKPRSLGGGDEKVNLSEVDPKKHEAWHLLFSNKTPEAIAQEINRVWLDPNWVFVPRKLTKV